MPCYSFLLSVLCCCLVLSQLASASQKVSLPGCPSTCGNLTIPYPFGIGKNCARKDFHLTCNHSFYPPKTFMDTGTPKLPNDSPFLATVSLEVLNVSLDPPEARVKGYRAYDCYSKNGSNRRSNFPLLANDDGPYTLSNVRNKFTVLGCDSLGLFLVPEKIIPGLGECLADCDGLEQVVDGSCSGKGCCQLPIPKGLKGYAITVSSHYNHTNVSDFNPCGYAFIADQEWFTFRSVDITNKSVYRSDVDRVPMVLDWVAGNESCAVASRNTTTFACRSQNSYCYDSNSSATGHFCKCSSGYEGNPYLHRGCQDIDECHRPEDYPCNGVCSNIPGSYTCMCPKGKVGNAMTYGCRYQISTVAVILGTVFPALFVTVLTICLYGASEKRKRDKLARKLYQQNGGPVLEDHLSTHRDIQNRFKIFTKEDMEKATNKFDDRLVLGRGGQGKVYKGILSDGECTAIKKSVHINDAQNDSFVNEIIILLKICHPNVVKLRGCCLEVDTPYLVYEFVPNKTLFDHIHGTGLSWEKRLRIAAGAARALAHLHTAGIYHQDVKSTNILLTTDFTAKISDFGLSRLVPNDAKALSTLVQGTVGYLDPEFILSHKLTCKSDVFSFGVVLAELLTGKVPLSSERSGIERSLAQHFKYSMEENKLFDILDREIVDTAADAVRAQITEVATLADQCLNMKGKDRPDMMVLFQKLDEMWRSGYNQSAEDEKIEETESLLGIQCVKPSYEESEEVTMLYHSTRSDSISAFGIEAGR